MNAAEILAQFGGEVAGRAQRMERESGADQARRYARQDNNPAARLGSTPSRAASPKAVRDAPPRTTCSAKPGDRAGATKRVTSASEVVKGSVELRGAEAAPARHTRQPHPLVRTIRALAAAIAGMGYAADKPERPATVRRRRRRGHSR